MLLNFLEMNIFKRLFFFLLVNLGVVAMLMLITSLFDIEPYLSSSGLNLFSLFIYALIIGFSGSLISLLLSKWMAKTFMGVEVIQEPSNHVESKLINIVNRLAHQGNLKMPEVGIYHSPEANAFATGWGKNHSLVAVSSGLLNEMNDAEVEGVLAHEMAHVANGDMVTMALIQGVVNTFVIFSARIAAFVVSKAIGGDKDEGMSHWVYLGTSILFEIVFGILASTIVFWFSRRREFAADEGGAQFVGKQKMIAALSRLQTLVDRVDTHQQSLATMKISDQPSRLTALFSTHPRLEKRIEALKMAAI